MSDAPVTLFIPFGSGYGQPGLTLRAETPKELDAVLQSLKEASDDELSLLDSILSEVETVKAALLLKFPQEEKPARQASNTTVTPPAVGESVPTCNHGPMKWRQGTSRSSGKEYKGWFSKV
jgi:hypothetical protein